MESKTREDIEQNIDNTPTVRFVSQVLSKAVKRGASDIHFEPFEKSYRIRYRLDGLLKETTPPPYNLANYIVARLKVMANLDISERRLPQDGRFKLTFDQNNVIDFRINTCPTLWGEKVVVRVLDTSNIHLQIQSLGMDVKQQHAFYKAIQQSHGIILITGPTGSGKTVTLYSALNYLNKTEKNIVAVEDPVEIQLQGINQVEMNAKVGLTFAKTLRAFLRQDPDIIMLGEMRDLETADIAVKASQTGHLVLSTLHTNNAAESITRLNNMGIAAYNIASSLILIIAQRLVRKLCENCKTKIELPDSTLREIGFIEEALTDLSLYKAQSCQQCENGFKGRIGVFEVLSISDKIRELILLNASTINISKQAEKENTDNLRQAGLKLVGNGLTSLEELSRVINF